MVRSSARKLQRQYGRFTIAVAMVIAAVAVGITLQPRNSIASGSKVVEVQAPTRHAVLRFGDVYVAYAMHSAPRRPCWSVHSPTGEVLGVFANEDVLTTFFSEVDPDALREAAGSTG